MSLYQQVSSTEKISQGDILFQIPILIAEIDKVDTLPDFSTQSLKEHTVFDILRSDIIILSQACDLVDDPSTNRKPIEFVVCANILPINLYSKTVVLETNSGRRPNYYLLHKETPLLDKSYIIDFTKLFSIPYTFLSLFASKSNDRFRPTNPYLEQMSHQFGNFFSRIGTDFERKKEDLIQEYELLIQNVK